MNPTSRPSWEVKNIDMESSNVVLSESNWLLTSIRLFSVRLNLRTIQSKIYAFYSVVLYSRIRNRDGDFERRTSTVYCPDNSTVVEKTCNDQ